MITAEALHEVVWNAIDRADPDLASQQAFVYAEAVVKELHERGIVTLANEESTPYLHMLLSGVYATAAAEETSCPATIELGEACIAANVRAGSVWSDIAAKTKHGESLRTMALFMVDAHCEMVDGVNSWLEHKREMTNG